jgi:hypothetical protein
VRKGSDEQFSKWIPRFTSLRAKLSLSLFLLLILLPACGLILCFTFEIYRQAVQHVREDTLWFPCLMVLPA